MLTAGAPGDRVGVRDRNETRTETGLIESLHAVMVIEALFFGLWEPVGSSVEPGTVWGSEWTREGQEAGRTAGRLVTPLVA